MQTIGFGLSAPIAFDAMLAAGDELVVGFVITVLIALNISARGVSAGVTLACLFLLPFMLTANPTAVWNLSWLTALVSLIGLLWMSKCVLTKQTRSTILGWGEPIALLRYQLQRLTSSRDLSIVLAGVSAFLVVVLLGVEISQELGSIARHTPSVLPLTLGVLIAMINTFGIGTMLVLFLSKRPDLSLFGSTNLRQVIGALLIAFGAYCGGRSVAFDWPGDELAIAGMALVFWVLGRWLQVCGSHRTQN